MRMHMNILFMRYCNTPSIQQNNTHSSTNLPKCINEESTSSIQNILINLLCAFNEFNISWFK